PQSVRENVDVMLVEVPVRVLDRSGEPVRGLTAADFTLLDQGRPQTLTAVDAIELGGEAGAPEPRSVPPAARRRYLLLFDFSFSRPRAVVAARRAAREFVLDGMRDTDLAAVATYSLQTGVRLLVTFSSDRAALAAAIETLGLEPAERSDPLQMAYHPRGTPALSARESSDQKQGESSAERGQEGITEILSTMASLDRARTDEYERGRVRALIRGFRDLGRVLEVVEGRKEIVLLSEGFPSRLLVGGPETSEEQQWMIQGDVWKVDADRRFGNTALRSDLSDMGEFLQRNHCVIHTVDIAGFATELDGAAPGEPGGSVPRMTQNALFDLSKATGGETFRSTTDIDGELRRLARRTSLVYVLAYRPDRRDGEGKYHALKVKVGRSGVKVVSRPGYFERRNFRQRTPLERSLSAADIIANEIPFSDIAPRVLATPFAGPAPGGEALLSVVIEIPGGEFLQGETGDRTTLEIYAYAFDGSQRVADFLAEPLGLDVARASPRLSKGGIRYFGELRLPPGDYRLRTLVRNANTGRTGLTVTSLRVPSFGAGEHYLLDPVFLEAGTANWIAVRGTTRREAEKDAPAPQLASLAGLGGENVVPAAAPHVAPGSTTKVCLVSYHLGGAAEKPDTFRIGSELVDADGRTLSPATISLLGRTPPEPDGKRVFVLAFTAPPDIAPGRYGLRVFMEDTSTSKRGQSSAVFVVP
ncbi:MAG: VWA domain-containing protein, partial [Thermoanaerobaculia bacterium]